VSWTTPKTWAYKETLSSADMNTYISDNLTALQNGTGWATNAIVLGYEEITTPFTTTINGSDVDVTNVAVTVTVPEGGRKIKITAYAPSGYVNTNACTFVSSIKESSTLLNETEFSVLANKRMPITIIAVLTPTAGSHTYKLAVRQDQANTLTVDAGATYPAFILVEYI